MVQAKSKSKSEHGYQGLVIILVVLSVLLLIHGITRAYPGTVGRFGEFLAGNGIPMGLAWAHRSDFKK